MQKNELEDAKTFGTMQKTKGIDKRKMQKTNKTSFKSKISARETERNWRNTEL